MGSVIPPSLKIMKSSWDNFYINQDDYDFSKKVSWALYMHGNTYKNDLFTQQNIIRECQMQKIVHKIMDVQKKKKGLKITRVVKMLTSVQR